MTQQESMHGGRTKVRLVAYAATLALLAGAVFGVGSVGNQAAADSPSSAHASPDRSRGASFERVEGRWIVDLVDDARTRDSARDVARDHGGRVSHLFESVIGGFTFVGPDDRAEELRDDPRVENVNPDLVVEASGEHVPRGVRRIRAWHERRKDAHIDLGVHGNGQNVAILDTGIDVDHPDLAVLAGLGKDCVGGGTVNDQNGHGTHVAGIVGARVNGHGFRGVAPNARVVPVRVLDSGGAGSVSSLICGVNHVTRSVRDGNPHNDLWIANMSLNGRGGPGHCTDGGLREAICRSIQAGVTYTVSAGNNDAPTGHFFPGNYPDVITVSAYTDYDGWPTGAAGCRQLFSRTECDDTLWTRTNYGWQIDVTAPGVLIPSTAVGGGGRVRTGTSHAAPHAAGVAALIRQLRPGWNLYQVRAAMREGGECPDGKRNGQNTVCRDHGRWRSDEDKWTEPLVNAYWAVKPLL